MPGEEESRLGLQSAQLQTSALTTTISTTTGGGSATGSIQSSSSTGASSSSSLTAAAAGGRGSSTCSAALPKVSLPSLALSSSNSSIKGASGLFSGTIGGYGGGGANTITSLTNTGNTTTPLTPILIASCPPSNSNTTTVNNNLSLTQSAATTTTTITTNHNRSSVASNSKNAGPGGSLDGVLDLGNNHQNKQQPFQSNPLTVSGARPVPSSLLANLNNSNSVSSSGSASSSGGLLSGYNNSLSKHQQHPPYHQYQYQQQTPQQQPPQLSLKSIIATSNGNPSSAFVAETIQRDTGTCNGHGSHPCGGGGGGGRPLLDDDEIDEAEDSSKLELQLQFAGIDNETAVDVDVDEEDNNFEAGIEGGPMCTDIPPSIRTGGGGGGGGSSSGSGEGAHPSSSFPGGGDAPGGGGGPMVVASSTAAAGSVAAATSTTSSSAGAIGTGATGPTNSLAAVVGSATAAAATPRPNSRIADDEEDEEEDVEGGKTVECTEVVVPDQTFAEKCLFYTTAFFILLAVFSLFAFLFLVPFVIDPAFTTIFMEFDPEPAFCQTVSFEQMEGLSNCNWTSCREGCTREVYSCKQIRVNYRSARKSHSALPHPAEAKERKVDFQKPQQLKLQQQLRRPNNIMNSLKLSSALNNNNNFINNNYHGGSSSFYQLASSSNLLRRSSEHSGSSLNTPFHTIITNNKNIHNNNVNSFNSLLKSGAGSGLAEGTGGSVINTYHSSVSGAGGHNPSSTDLAGLRDVSNSKLSKSSFALSSPSSSSYYINLMNALHHSSKYAVRSSGGDDTILPLDLSTAHTHSNSASNVRLMNGGVAPEVMYLRVNKHSQQQKGASVQPLRKNGNNGDDPTWDYVGAHLFPNVKGCGYPPVIVCSDFVEKYGQVGANFTCFYSKVDRALVVTQYDMSRVIMDLVYSMAIPIPSFIISVVYLIFAYFRIYNTESSSSTHETGGGGRAERLNSSSTTTNIQNPGSADRGGGGSSADDPDGETSLSIDDKTCIIQRSTSRGLNALSDKLPNSGKGLHAQVIEMNDLNPQLRHPVDGDVFLPQKRNNNCSSSNPATSERNGPTNPAAKNKGGEPTLLGGFEETDF